LLPPTPSHNCQDFRFKKHENIILNHIAQAAIIGAKSGANKNTEIAQFKTKA